MAKSLMIEIDEATKDIMTELQDGLTKNIEIGISNSLQSVMQQQRRSIEEIESILNLQLSTVSEDLAATKKPIMRMARDVEETIRLMMKFEKLQMEQDEQLTNLQQQQIESIQQEIEQIISKLSKTQEEVLAKGIQSFEVKTGEAALTLAAKLQEMQQQFSNVTETTQAKLIQQYEYLIDISNQLADKNHLLQQQMQTFKEAVSIQAEQFEHMKMDLKEQVESLVDAQQLSFDAHITALTKQHEVQMIRLTDKLTEQVVALEGVAQQLTTSNEQANGQLKEELNISIESMKILILRAIEQNKGFELMQEKLTAMETAFTSSIKEQAIKEQIIIDKLANIEKDLAYARLPFYKKWFTKRENF